jgi:hypothetical protein
MSGQTAQLLKEAAALIDSATALLEEDKYLQSAAETAKVLKLLPALEANHQGEQLEDVKRALLELEQASSKAVAEVQRAHAELDASAEGWEKMRDYDGISTLYKKEEGTDFHTLRVEGNVQAPLFNILAVFYEIDLFKLWLPTYQMLGLKESSVIGKLSKTKMLADFKLNMPWPITNRDCVLSITGVDCMDRKEDGTPPQIICLLESRGGSKSDGEGGDIADTYAGKPIAPETCGFVRCEILRGCVILTPAETNSFTAQTGKSEGGGEGVGISEGGGEGVGVSEGGGEGVGVSEGGGEGVGATAGANGTFNGTFVQIMCSVDPKLTMVPVWLINMVGIV